jgi:(p)ppGpp synthase/HD superfamily hydrolase
VTGRRTLPDEGAACGAKTQRALTFAERRHAGQQRSFEASPFIAHPVEVASLLYQAGAADRVIAAGLLHDVLEKTSTDAPELEAQFGRRITRLVVALTEDTGITGYANRKAALRQQVAAAGSEALMIFAADKVSKTRELRLAIKHQLKRHEPPANSLLRPRRMAHYRRCLGLLEEHLGQSALVAQLRTELSKLERVLAGVASAALDSPRRGAAAARAAAPARLS